MSDGEIIPSQQIDRDDGHDRETMRMLITAVRNRWDIPEGMKNAVGKIAARIALEGRTDRERLRAVELLAALDRDNIDALIACIKTQRLDSGQATERIELKPITFERRD